MPLPWWPALSSSLADWNSTSMAVSYCPDFWYRDANVRAFWCASYAWPALIRGNIAFKARVDDAVDAGGMS